MKYMLLACRSAVVELAEPERQAISLEVEAWVGELERTGLRVRGQALAPVVSATTLRVRGGELLVGDGPFADTEEQITRIEIVECSGLEEAVEVASRHPVARVGAIEVRPFYEQTA